MNNTNEITTTITRSPGTSFNNLAKTLRTSPSAAHVALITQSFPYFDLFAIARLIAAVAYLKNFSSNVTIDFTAQGEQQHRSLRRLGVLELLNSLNVSFRAPDQQYLRPKILTPDRFLLKKAGHEVLSPLRLHKIDPSNPQRCLQQALSRVKADVQKSLEELLPFLTVGDLEPEISAIVFQALRELVSNSIEHSGGAYFITGLTLSAETGTPPRPKYRSSHPSGKHQYDLLTADLGCGISSSIRRKLGLSDAEASYYSFAPWTPEMTAALRAEEQTISSIFRGNLILRRGRRSQGLHDLFEVVASFDGALTLGVGRTVSTIPARGSGHPYIDFQEKSAHRNLFLPGTTLAALLPSRRLTALQAEARARRARHTRPHETVEIRCLRARPSGILQGGPVEGLRRRAERDADRLRHESLQAPSETLVELDLGAARHLDIDYIDALLQELAKREGQQDLHLLNRLLVTNVPMRVIHTLRTGAAAAFLQNLGFFVLLFDVNDEPAFLGLQEPLEGSLTHEDLAQVVIRCGTVSDRDLKRTLELGTPTVIERFGAKLTKAQGGIFSRITGQQPGFTCPSLKASFHARRSALKDEILAHTVREPHLSLFLLRNGRSVTSLIDFCQLWSAPDLVTDGVKLLLSELPRRPWDTVCAFRNNGDRLASRLARIMHIENLSILTLDSDFIPDNIGISVLIVCDVVFDGDESSHLSAWVNRIAQRLSNLGGEWSFASFLDLSTDRHTTPEWLQSAAFVGSVFKRAHFSQEQQATLPQTVALSPFRRGLRHGTNYALSKARWEGPRPAVESRLTSAETSSEFWHLATEAGFLSCTREAREHRELVFSDFTERLLESRYTRRLVDKFVSEFVRRTLRNRVHVILHPVHPVGAYLAQLAAESLQNGPLVLPVHQQRYGGNLEVSNSDWAFAQAEVARLQKRTEGKLNALVLDDSVISGRSLVFMTGLASRLGLSVIGGLVLIDRLAAETRAGVELVTGELATLFRLRLPEVAAGTAPDSWLRLASSHVAQRSSSHLVGECCDRIQAGELSLSQILYHRNSLEGFRSGGLIPPLAETSAKLRGDGRLIFENVVFHPDPDVIDLERRVAAVFNARHSLTREGPFWDTLTEMALPRCDATPPPAANLAFVASTLWLLANSLVAKEPASARRIVRCTRRQLKALVDHVQEPSVARHLEVLLLVLARLRSENLAAILGQLASRLVRLALSESPPASDLARAGARRCLSALAFALAWYLEKRPGQPFEQALRKAGNLEYNTDEAFATLDILFPAFQRSAELRAGFQVVHRAVLSDVLRLLRDDQNPVRSFLEGAPGYSCSLLLLREALGADTILLYSKSPLDDRYYLRHYQSRYTTTDIERLDPSFMDSAALPANLRTRMDRQIFWSSPRGERTEWLDAICKSKPHSWALGAAARFPGNGVLHYVVVGFREIGDSPGARNSSFFAWLYLEKAFRKLLSRIHENYSGGGLKSITDVAVLLRQGFWKELSDQFWMDTRPPALDDRRQFKAFVLRSLNVLAWRTWCACRIGGVVGLLESDDSYDELARSFSLPAAFKLTESVELLRKLRFSDDEVISLLGSIIREYLRLTEVLNRVESGTSEDLNPVCLLCRDTLYLAAKLLEKLPERQPWRLNVQTHSWLFETTQIIALAEVL